MNRLAKVLLIAGGLLAFFTYSASFGADLSSVTATPLTQQAGEESIYQFTFTTSDTGNGTDYGIPVDGKIVIGFPAGFNVSGVQIANLSTSGGFESITTSGSEVTVVRDSTGALVDSLQTVTLIIASVRNNIVAANYSVTIETRTNANQLIDSGTSSLFSITHGDLDHFIFDPITNQITDTPFTITIRAKDQYDNTVTSFSSTANINDKTSTLSPVTTTNFIAGVWTGNVTITQTSINNSITVTSGGDAGISNSFNVDPGPVDHFTFATISSPRTAGIPFSVTITAEDANNNRVTNFNDTVTLLDNTGTLTPNTSTNFVSGQWTGNVTITRKQTDVFISATNNGAQGTSNLFNVQAAGLSYFVVSNITNQTAGVPFIINVNARDQYDNTADSFTGRVIIADLSTTIQPTLSGNFSQGQWSGSVTISDNYTNDIITVTRSSGGSQEGSSNGFNVVPGSLDHFEISSIVSPQTAGTPFTITIVAKDASNNTISSFSETASLSDLTNTISPSVTGPFSNGLWTGNIAITQARISNIITATSSGKNGYSNAFNLNSASLHHFSFEQIGSPQIARQHFNVTITARDQFENHVTQFNQTVSLTDETGTLEPGASGNFSAGQWTGQVRIFKAQDDVVITASRGGVTGYSNAFNVHPSVLHHFIISPISTQAAGELFDITITAQDFDSNRVENFVNTVDISDLTNTIQPSRSGNFELGQWIGNVRISNTFTDNKIEVSRTGGVETGQSNEFDVVAGEVNEFIISAISSPKTAGQPFSITLTAVDENSSVVTNFNGTVNLIDLTGSLLPQTTGSFNSGVWTGNVTITKSYTGNVITASGSGRSGASNAFNVQSNVVHHFVLASISSPQTAGQNFNISLTAKDSYENTVTSFSQTATLSDNTNTIAPTESGTFTNGLRTQSVSISDAEDNIQITAQNASAAGTSNVFNVVAAALHHFRLAPIGTQAAGNFFPISVTAEDTYNNTRSQFNGTVDISDLTSTVTPAVSGNFSDGKWTGNVKISQARTNDIVTVRRTGGSEEGDSNPFNVISSTVDHFEFASIGSPQQAGVPLTVTITAKDAENNTVTSFNGSGVLSDETNTLQPESTGAFVNGVWSDDVTVTTSWTGNSISITYSGKTSTSNSFDVNHASLHHFRFEQVTSPQTAGAEIDVTIYAEDIFNNRVQSFSTYVDLNDNTQTISPTRSDDFSSGAWSGAVQITKSATDVQITANRLGSSGQSNQFNITPALLHHFALAPISTQAAGEPFSITVIAEDLFGNIQTDFTGSGATVDISDLTNTISPDKSGDFILGQWTGTVVVTNAYEDDQIRVQRTSGTEFGTSASFDVISSTVDYFVFNTINSPQQAGTPFSVTITAKDAQGNTVTDFNGTGELEDLTAAISPSETGNFSAGTWTGSITVTSSIASNRIKITSSGKTSSSNTFEVMHNDLHHFRFETVGSPQTAGTSFDITIYAEDSFDNRVTSFETYVDLNDNSLTITPAQSGNFSSGSWTGPVQISKSMNDVKISANRFGSSGETNKFNVLSAALHHFTISSISTQAAGEPFSISVTAQDEFDNVRTQFSGIVTISDLTNTVTPVESGNFTQGIWSGSVVVTEAFQNNIITVQRKGGNESGVSTLFDVISSTVDYFVFNNISSPREAGVPFSITITAKDAQGNTVTDFNGTGNLSDETKTIFPIETGSFNNGAWSGNVTITESISENEISITSSGKLSYSNSFDVTHTDLDHFRFENINSPQIAGSPFLITITAEDAYDNTVTSFATYTTLTEKTGTIFPAVTADFVNGVWSDQIIITKSETDVKISANSSGKSGQSNLFNVSSGALSSFSISEMSTQAAGEPFPVSVTALDGFSNVAESFSGTVDISELTGTIDPVRSESFAEGRWTGNVTISQVMNNNQITVLRTGGTQTGLSNLFNVISSDVDYFLISAIPGPVVAGQAISISITAKDRDHNTVDSFDGTASLSDLSNTISPKTTTNFANGIWNGNVILTDSWDDNVITVTSSGEVGNSNPFDVIHDELHHFSIAPVYSPQVAGTPFTINITAKDQFENTVKTFVDHTVLTDITTTITPGLSTNFTAGVWTGDVSITKSQNDVQITASGGGKQGTSNSFNIISGPMDYFTIDEISTQATGEPFQLSVTAQDASGNVANTFTGTVDISDLTTTITPVKSDNFIAGKWSGNAIISSVINENKVTVLETGGTKFGESNIFPVISSNVDHFTISTITSPQIAGDPFQITIMAEDANNNVAISFNGTVSLSDLTATLTPFTTTTFVDGVWSGFVTITKAKEVDKITVNALGKAGVSNEFAVMHGEIDHFLIEQIASPQIAGNPFMLTLTAEDSMDNRVFGFTGKAQIFDNTNSMTPTETSNFINGQWSEMVSITKSQTDIFITAEYQGKSGVSNKFYIKPNQVDYIKVTDAAGGKGLEVGERTVTLDEKFRLYASGYDDYDNYVRDVMANWSVLGNLDPPSPLTGESTVFDPQTPGTSGTIVADSLTLKSDSTGTISVGAISFVKIFTLPGGAGVEMVDTLLTADDNLTLYCAGFDAGANYIGDVVVKWQSSGNLFPAITDSSAWIRFEPTNAPSAGNITVTHSTAADDQTGTISVVPGSPVSEIVLVADPAILPSDGTSLSSVTSDVIFDADGNAIAKNTLFTIYSDIGSITSLDVSAEFPGVQIAANDLGKISFVYRAPSTGGIAHINVSSPEGSSTGFVNLVIASLNILSVSSTDIAVSRSQQNVPVTMTVKNLGSSTVANLVAGLTFTGAPPVVDRNDEFSAQRTDSFNDIPGGVTRVLTFDVDVSAVARLDTVTINGYISGKISGVNVGIDSAQIQDSWLIQSPAEVMIENITSAVDTVSQGQENVIVSMFVKNTGQASAEVVHDTLVFKTYPQMQNISSELIAIPFNNNPELIAGGGTEQFNFYVNLLSQTTLGNIIIDGGITARDENSKIITADTSAGGSTHRWYVKEAPLVRIQSLRPSTPQGTVSQNQLIPWHIMVKVKNDGGTAVKLDSVRAAFLSGGTDITPEYRDGLVYDTIFMARGNDRLLAYSQDSLRINMNKTGSTLGPVTIPISLYMTDISTGKPIIDQTNTGIIVVQPGQLLITHVLTSVDSVTRNQGQDWNVKVVLENKGGSDIVIKRDRPNSYIRFSSGTDFTIIQPTELANGGLVLEPDAVDTMTFVIDGTGWESGASAIDAFVKGTETTTGELIETSLLGAASILVEEPANVRILSVQVDETPNGTTVNTNQQFKLNVVLENMGMDQVKMVYLRLQSNGTTLDSAVVGPFNKLIPGRGGLATKAFIIDASSQEEAAERFFVTIDSAVAQNTPEPAAVVISAAVDASETIAIQKPAILRIVDIITPQTQIRAGQVGFWDIKVLVVDSGSANIDLDLIASEGVYISKAGVLQTDYSIPSPDTLQSGGLTLFGNVVDTLLYRVYATGNNSGQVTITAELLGIDLNNQQQLSASFSKNIAIQTSAAVRLAALEAVCFNCNPLDNIGFVNKGQPFQLKVDVANSGRVGIDSILVRLTSNGSSQIENEYMYIASIAYDQQESLLFNISAFQDIALERFSAQIISAKEQGTGNPASVDDSKLTIDMRIQEPAKLRVDAATATGDLMFTPQQEFIIKSSIINVGEADILGTGSLELIVPDNYQITSGMNTVSVGKEQIVEWRILTPDTASGPDTFRVVINTPLIDKNSNQPAQIVADSDTLIAYTTTETIIVNSEILGTEASTGGVHVLSPGEEYSFKSTIQYSPAYSNVVADIKLPDNYRLSAESDSSQNVTSLVPVIWKVIAPDSSIDQVRTARIEVMADGELIYEDLLKLRTIEIGFITSAIRIVSPPGAGDGILSTDQIMQVEVEVSSNGVNDNIWTKLILPQDFSLVIPEVDSLLIAAGQGVKAQWRIKAASKVASNIGIQTYATGRDLSGIDVSSDTVEVPIYQLVKKANLKVRAAIISPEQATDGVVTADQVFRVEAFLENEPGAARIYGNYSLELSLPDGYGTNSAVKSAAAGSSIIWDITAPDHAASKESIEIHVPDGMEPRDENSDTTAFFASGARFAFVDITTTEKSVNVYWLDSGTPNTVAKGETGVTMLSLVLINSEDDPQSNEEVLLKGITAKIKNRNGEALNDPASAISRIAVVKHSEKGLVYGSLSNFNTGSSLPINFAQSKTISAGNPDTISVVVDVAQNAGVVNFMIEIESDTSIYIEEALTGQRPAVKLGAGMTFPFGSDFITLMANNLKDSFGNYPNPFGSSDRPSTTVTYYLKADANVDIKIYTLLGELVWSKSYKSMDLQGRAGSHDGDVVWDGRNDKGDMVLNGVYVSYISSSSGESAVTKIAVLK